LQTKKNTYFFKIFSILFVFLIFFTNCTEQNSEIKPVKIKKIVYDDFGFVKDSLNVKTGTVKKNETLADIMIPLGLTYQQITDLFVKAKPIFDFRSIRPDKNYFAYFNNDSTKSINTFIYEIDKINYVKVRFLDTLEITKQKKRRNNKRKNN